MVRITLMVRASLLALKASRKGMLHKMPRLFQLIAELTHQDSSLSMIRTLLQYICVVDNDSDLTEYIKRKEKISTASSSQLEAWIDASLDAESVEQVFNG